MTTFSLQNILSLCLLSPAFQILSLKSSKSYSLKQVRMSSMLSEGGNQSYDEAADWTRESSAIKFPLTYQDSSGGRRKTSPRQSVGKDEDDEEDCCCCPVDPVLCWFRFFHTISGCIGMATMAANIFVLVTIDIQSLNYKDIIMRSYAVIFCIIIVIAGKIMSHTCKHRYSCNPYYMWPTVLFHLILPDHDSSDHNMIWTELN